MPARQLPIWGCWVPSTMQTLACHLAQAERTHSSSKHGCRRHLLHNLVARRRALGHRRQQHRQQRVVVLLQEGRAQPARMKLTVGCCLGAASGCMSHKGGSKRA